MKHTGRHTGAFILLFLTEGDSYGRELLRKCEKELPFNPIDDAIIYRTLNKLESEGAVESYLDTSNQNKPIRKYKITKFGEARLNHFYEDIKEKMENLIFFIDKYNIWKEESSHD